MVKEANTEIRKSQRRSVLNYALKPYLQIKLAIYSMFLTLLFAATISAVVYVNLGNLLAMIVELTSVEDEVKELIMIYSEPLKTQSILIVLIYVVLSIVTTIVYTHRLIGPTVAFRRHIRKITDGDFTYRTKLRDDDAFQEVADDLNRLSEHLAKKS